MKSLFTRYLVDSAECRITNEEEFFSIVKVMTDHSAQTESSQDQSTYVSFCLVQHCCDEKRSSGLSEPARLGLRPGKSRILGENTLLKFVEAIIDIRV